MFYLNWIYALVTFVIEALLFLYIQWRFSGRSDWIDIRQAVLFRASRRGLLTLQTQKQDPKYWRPSVLMLVRARKPSDEIVHLAAFLNRVKESGLFIIGEAVTGESATGCYEGDELPARKSVHAELSKVLPGLQSFPQQAVASTGRLACMNLMLGSGLGSMVPDTVAMVLPEADGKLAFDARTGAPVDSMEEFQYLLQDLLRCKKNLFLAANFTGAIKASARVDLWLLGDLSAPLSGAGKDEQAAEKTQVSLLLQLGALCRAEGICDTDHTRPQLRLLHCVASGEGDEAALVKEDVLRQWLRWARIPNADAKMVEAPGLPPNLFDVEAGAGSFSAANEQMRSHSGTADLVLAMLPVLPISPKSSLSGAYLHSLPALTAGLPPTVLSLNGQGFAVITTVI